MRIRDCSSDVCSSDLFQFRRVGRGRVFNSFKAFFICKIPGVYPHLLHTACCCFCCVGCKMNICDEGYPVAPPLKFFLNMSNILCLADACSCYSTVFADGFQLPDVLCPRPVCTLCF